MIIIASVPSQAYNYDLIYVILLNLIIIFYYMSQVSMKWRTGSGIMKEKLNKRFGWIIILSYIIIYTSRCMS